MSAPGGRAAPTPGPTGEKVLIEHHDRVQATHAVKALLRNAGITVRKIRTTTQSNGSLLSKIEIEVTPGALDLALSTLRRRGYEDVSTSAVSRTATVYARSWQRGKRP